MPSLPEKLASFCAATLDESAIIVVGGRRDDNDYSGATYIYDMIADGWTRVADMPTPRADILFLKRACSILRQSSNPLCGFSLMEQ